MINYFLVFVIYFFITTCQKSSIVATSEKNSLKNGKTTRSISHLEVADNLYYDIKEYNYRSGFEQTTSKSLTFHSTLSGTSFSLNGSLIFKIHEKQATIDLKYTLLGAASVSVQVNYEDDDGLRIAGNLPVGSNNQGGSWCFQATNKTKISDCPVSKKSSTNITSSNSVKCDETARQMVTSSCSWQCINIRRVPCVDLRVLGESYKIGEEICP